MIRLGPTTASASIGFQTTPGSAIAGVDFTPASGTADFAVGESTVDIVIDINNNPEAEPPEAFTVTLSAPSPAGLLLYNPVTATVNIVDAQDSDFDGLPDAWELSFFDDINLLDAIILSNPSISDRRIVAKKQVKSGFRKVSIAVG